MLSSLLLVLATLAWPPGAPAQTNGQERLAVVPTPGSLTPHPEAGIAAMLNELGVVLNVTERPTFPRPTTQQVTVTLYPQIENPGAQIVSFGLPFPPGVLKDPGHIHLTTQGGTEIPLYAEPLVHWWIDAKQGTLRSVLVQFEWTFEGTDPETITVAWDRPRQLTRPHKTPIPDTQALRDDDRFVFHCPKVLAVLPPEWLCTSLVAWQQVPASANDVAEWFDRHLLDQFPASLQHISSERYAPHLYDRPATYAKLYVRHGRPDHLVAALRAADFYTQHLGEDGFFALKPGDFKYVYAEGSAILYTLTGDERYRDAVLRGLKSWARWEPVAYQGEGFWTERHTAFGMAAYLHAYELTGNSDYIAAAVPFFNGVYRLQTAPLDGLPPDGAWLHTAESHGDGNGWTTSPWMSALLMDSIWKLWMLTGDSRCPVSLAMYAKFIDVYAVTPDRQRLFYMANSSGRGDSVNPEYPPHHLEACYMLAMGYYLSGGRDPGLLETYRALWPPLLSDDANTPPRKFTWRFRETSMLIWFLDQTMPTGSR